MMTPSRFKRYIKNWHRKHRRDMPWRITHTRKDVRPYHILVSEIMLQQTQVSRVEKKYPEFIRRFPSFQVLASAPQRDVLENWQGLGYNRRALNLHRSAQIITTHFKGRLPKEEETLTSLPGVGEATAGSLRAFAHNLPAVFIETNIRSVFLYYFFPDKKNITDKSIMPLIEKTLDTHAPREWYYALMDHGTMLKKQENPGRRSRHYTKQSAFKGSDREIRSALLKHALSNPTITKRSLYALPFEVSRIRKNLQRLIDEGFLTTVGEDRIRTP